MRYTRFRRRLLGAGEDRVPCVSAQTEETARPARRRILRVAVGAFLLVILGFLVVIFAGVWNLYQVKSEANAAQDAMLTRDTDTANAHLQEAQEEAADARFWTESLPWRALNHLPWVGSAFASVADSALVINGIATDVLPPLSEAASGMLGDGSGAFDFDLAKIAPIVPALDSASAKMAKLDSEAAAIQSDTAIGPVNDAVIELQEKSDKLSKALATGKVAAQLAPSMLGGKGPRDYLLAFQTPAEARGTGGLLGGWAILHAENGSLKQTESGSNYDLDSPGHFFRKVDPAPADLGEDWYANWGNFNRLGFWRDSNFGPDFADAAKLWKGIFEKSTGGRQVDGVISTDPIALKYILEATGPVNMPDGEEINAGNVADITLNGAYFRYPHDQAARKQYLNTLQGKVVERLTGDLNKGAMLTALGRAVSEGRFQVWSADPDEQALLEQSSVAHTLPDSPAPFSTVSIISGTGSKLDYYLKREISYTGEACVGDRRKTVVKLKLTNDAPTDVDWPPFLKPNEALVVPGPPGSTKLNVMLYETQGTKETSITQDGKPIFATPRFEHGRPVDALIVMLEPGESTEIVFELDEPSAPGKPEMLVQPLTDEAKVTFDVPECKAK